jgi:capsular exopolysaccharide synthesis family protein
VNPQNLTTLSDYLNVLRRRAWIVVLCVVVAGGSAYLYSKHQTPEYSASATVGLTQNPVTSQINGNKNTQVDVNGFVAHQVGIADSEYVATQTLKNYKTQLQAAGVPPMTPSDFMAKTSVSGDTTNVQLNFSASGKKRPEAIALVNSFAKQYITTANTADLAVVDQQLTTIKKAIATDNKQLAAAVAQGQNGLITTIGHQLNKDRNTQQNLDTARTAITNHTFANRTLHAATDAAKVKPVLSKNLGIGIALGLVIGLALVGLLEALDNRVRRSEDLAAALGMPMLTKIPTPPRAFRKDNRLGMMEDDQSAHTEAYRKLRVNFDFANLGPRAKVVMLTSAVEQEGKSTTISNLAVAFARAGRKVALVDLDLRRPALNRFFGIEGRFGVTDVALGEVEAARALHTVDIPDCSGTLEVMPTGPLPPHPADFLEAAAVGELLQELAADHDIVLIDAAPVLPVSDSVILSKQVDALVVVARVSTLKRHVLADFHHALSALPVTKLGFILTAAEDEAAGYGGYGSYGTYGSYTQNGPAEQRAAADAVATNGTQDPARVSGPRSDS